MIHLPWGILNFALLFYLLITIFKALKLVKEKMGLPAALVIIIGFLSLISNINAANDTNASQEKITNQTSDVQNSFIKRITLENSLVTSYVMDVKYKRENNRDIPVAANTDAFGFVFGTAWKAENTIFSLKAGIFTYESQVIVRWNLIGITIYTEIESYKGRLP